MSRANDASFGEKGFRRVGRVGIDGRRSSTKTSLNEAPAHPCLESLPLRHRGVGCHAIHSCKDRALLRGSPSVADRNNRGTRSAKLGVNQRRRERRAGAGSGHVSAESPLEGAFVAVRVDLLRLAGLTATELGEVLIERHLA
jgi:hypothetical protein